jgi:hypothetical protein
MIHQLPPVPADLIDEDIEPRMPQGFGIGLALLFSLVFWAAVVLMVMVRHQ